MPFASARTIFWTIVAACFAAAAAGLLARAATHMADRWAHETTGAAVVRILATDEPDALSNAEDAIREAPGIAKAAIVTAERAAALLQEWGGDRVAASDLPPLRLIEVEFALDAPPNAAEALEARLLRQGIRAEVVAPGAGSNEATESAQVLRLAAWGGAGFLALMMAMIIALSARALAHRRGDLITAMADLGATPARAAREVGDEAAGLGFRAGFIGALAAAAAAAVIIYLTDPAADIEDIARMARPLDLAPLALTPLAAALLASFGARAAAASLHARAARLA
ncbi:MAG: hypothetical protein AB7L65_07845 [Hyphomonadaceae bacterium]